MHNPIITYSSYGSFSRHEPLGYAFTASDNGIQDICSNSGVLLDRLLTLSVPVRSFLKGRSSNSAA
jgi:hypothetical protein